jgi:hypothetical protein
VIVTSLIAAAMFSLIGAAAAIALRIPVPHSRAGRFGTWFLLGLGANGFLLFIVGRASIAVAVAAAIVLLLLRGKVSQPTRPDVGARAPLALALASLAVVFFVAINVPLADFDGRTTWLPKAVAIANEHSIRGPFFRGEGGLNLHNHYPLLLPLDAATLMIATRDLDVDRVRPFFVLIPIALVLALHDFLGWFVLALAWLPPLLVAHEGGALSAYSDLSAMAFFSMAVAAVMRKEASGGAWLAFLVLTKNEGLILAIALVLVARSWRLAIGPALSMAILAWWRMSIPDAYDERYGVLIRDLQLPRLVPAARALMAHAFDPAVWGVLWIVFIVAAVIRMRRRESLVIPAAIGIAFAAYAVAFAVTSWDIAELSKVAADRLLLHLAGPALIVVRDTFRE